MTVLRLCHVNFLAEIIAEAVWLYFRFPLSIRMVEVMLASSGTFVTHKTAHECAEKFRRDYANTIRCRTPRLGESRNTKIPGPPILISGVAITLVIRCRRTSERGVSPRLPSIQSFMTTIDSAANLDRQSNISVRVGSWLKRIIRRQDSNLRYFHGGHCYSK